MSSPSALRLLLVPLAVLPLVVLTALPVRAEKVTLEVDTPRPGDPAGDVTLVAGHAFAHDGVLAGYDVVVALDTSASTAASSGADVDGDGRSGWNLGIPGLLGRSTDADDTILHAQAAAVGALLEQLQPRRTRVGLVTFNTGTWVDAPLTHDYEEIRLALRDALERGPEGGTNMRSALLRASVELLGTRSAVSTRRDGAARVVVLVTDGKPTLPYSGSLFREQKAANVRVAVEAAETAKARGIRIHTFAVGKEAIDGHAPRRIARRSGGRYTAVEDPGKLPKLFAELDLSELAELRVRNLTLGEPASVVDLQPDGAFAALVATRKGTNELEVYARSRSGAEARQRIRIGAGGRGLTLTPEQELARVRLLEQLRQRDVAAKSRRALEVEVERSD